METLIIYITEVVDMGIALVVWMLVGWSVIGIVYAVHIIQAEQKGYMAEETWDEAMVQEKSDHSTLNRTLRCIWGLLWWPYYAVKLHRILEDSYPYYERRW